MYFFYPSKPANNNNGGVPRLTRKQYMRMQKRKRWNHLLVGLQTLLAAMTFGQFLVAMRLLTEKQEFNVHFFSSGGSGTTTTTTGMMMVNTELMEGRRLLQASDEIRGAPWRIPKAETSDQATKHFLFEETGVIMTSSGVHMTSGESAYENQVKTQLLDSQCGKKTAFAKIGCQREPEIYKCVSCSASSDQGTWYSAVSHAGAVMGLFDRNGQALVLDHVQDLTTWRFDIIVPLSQQDKQMRKFATRLGATLKKLKWWMKHLTLDIQILMTRYPKDHMEPAEELKFRTELAKLAALGGGPEKITFLQVQPRPGCTIDFSRSQAGNVLHRAACSQGTEPNCIVAMMDVDMDLSPAFFRNAQAMITPGVTAYMPIVWSEYNPATWELVDQLLMLYENKTLPKFSPHRGVWRQYGFGIYALAGADAGHVLYKEDFDGWGGEDNAFMNQVEDRLHVIRRREKGLTHVWHPKICDPSYVVPSQLRACMGSAATVEGSQLGLHLQKIKKEDPQAWATLMDPSRVPEPSAGAGAAVAAAAAAVSGASTVVGNGQAVLIIVATCRKNFLERVGTIAKTWGGRANLPAEVTVWYAVGSGPAMTAEAEQAGVDPNSVIVMNNVADDEYPPVRRNGAMIQHVANRVDAEGKKFNWILKVDDDTYVNYLGLQSFIKAQNNIDSTGMQVWGQRGFGRPGADREGMLMAGFTKPFCMGGPGYLMNYQTWRDTANGMDFTIKHVDTSPQRVALWHSDIVIGLAVQQATNAGCWDRESDNAQSKVLFAQNYKKEVDFVLDENLDKVITMHPLKKSEEMIHQHDRYIKKGMKVAGGVVAPIAASVPQVPATALGAPAPLATATTDILPSSGILIVVLTSHKFFVKRILSTKNTWAGESLPQGITIWYAVADGRDMTKDIPRAKITENEVIILKGVKEEEEIPVHKSAGVWQGVYQKMQAESKRFDWILRIDDDTFVNAGNLVKFVQPLNPMQHQLWGRRGFAQPGTPDHDVMTQNGLHKPFCLGGSGYIISFATLQATAQGLQQCVAAIEGKPADVKQKLWKSDVVIGLCTQQLTNGQASCWNRNDVEHSAKVFLPKTSSGGANMESTITFPFPSAFLL